VNAARIRWNFRTAFPRDVGHEVDEKHEAITSAIGGLTPWSAVIYQVYPRSFRDTDDNGVGDLNGITERLPYLVDLGECPRSTAAKNASG
jgi:hypothetical protein